MWLTLLPAIIGLLVKLLDILNSEAVQNKIKEAQNAHRDNEARKALTKNDTALVAALMADQHDRVLALCSSSGRRNDSGQRPAVGPNAPG